ncbi:GTP 3',8-cyclase MoaA, partial [Candidatus Aerophobetes bacterium]|nr:GTP 3',8-cyclase MoaA [Candidatus Aerophobetes bacterium]
MKIKYLRVSLTDRCNFSCIYCVPEKKVRMLKKEQLLSFEEITSLVKILSPWGLDKVRLTGGEPLLRKDITLLVRMLSEIKNIKQITLTTNGFLLEDMAQDLKKAGLSRVNVSLDSLNREKFKKITGCDALIQVLRGIEAVKKAGLEPVKINTVVLKNINDDEVTEFVRFALENSLILRFIEYMHFNPAGEKNWYIPNTLVKKTVEEKIGPLVPLESHAEQTAKYFLLKGTNLRVGFISPVSCPFCHKCSKL